MSSVEADGTLLRTARKEAGISIDVMARLIGFSKSHIGNVETGRRAISPEIIAAYEKVLGPIGDDMWRRRNITHPHVMRDKSASLMGLVAQVNQGEPGRLVDTPTSLAADELIAVKADERGAANLREWMREGQTATLRVNSLSVLARRSDPRDTAAIVEVLERDERVRELSLASSISRLMQWDWKTCRTVAHDVSKAPDPVRLAKRLAKDVVDTKHAEARWCAAHLLRDLAPIIH